MNKTPRLGKSGIEYLDYVWNFYSGCLNGCPYCWARKITERFQDHYPNGFEPTVYHEAFFSPLYLKKPSIIGCAFMGDLFGDWIDPNKIVEAMLPSGVASVGMSLKGWIYTTIEQCPQHKFLFLTKQPQNLPQWSPFPDNCWVGVSVTNEELWAKALLYLHNIKASIKYLSFEPCLYIPSDIELILKYQGQGDGRIADWVIIGSQTKPYQPPTIEAVGEIVRACDKAGVPVFLKDNLSDLIPVNSILRYGPAGELRLRQEMPNAIIGTRQNEALGG